jgi:hypothetical protein
MSESQKNSLGVEAQRALFDGQIQCLALTFYENERPPCGLSGIIDWHFHGAISRSIQMGAITGKVGECTYFPFTRNGQTFHVILAGAGHSEEPGVRTPVRAETLQTLQKNLISLGLSKIGVSKSDFGNVSSEFFAKHLKGVPLWIAP